MDFGERLKQLRNERHITQQELADIIKVRRPAISGYETKNQQPDYDKLCTIADFFSVSTDYLLGRTDMRTFTKPLTGRQAKLVELYSQLTPEDQSAILERAMTLLEIANKNKSVKRGVESSREKKISFL